MAQGLRILSVCILLTFLILLHKPLLQNNNSDLLRDVFKLPDVFQSFESPDRASPENGQHSPDLSRLRTFIEDIEHVRNHLREVGDERKISMKTHHQMANG